MTSAEEWQRRLIALVNEQINRRAQSTETAMRQEAGRIATGTVAGATIALSQLDTTGASNGQVLAYNSGTGEWEPVTNSPSLPWTSAGDILYYDGSVAQRLAIGTAGQALVVNTGATAPEWDTVLTNPMTTAEDIIVGGVSGAPARLGVGSNGDVLTVSGGSVGWAAPSGGGGLVLIASQTLASAATNIDFSSISSSYTHLRIVMQGQLDTNTAGVLFLYFNADYTDANYQSRYELSVVSTSTNEPRIGLWSGGTRAGGSTFANDLDIRIPFYGNASLVKRAWTEINYYDSNQSGDLVIGRGYVFHSSAANTNAVSAIRLSAGANQFIAGTVAELYGVL